MARLLMRPPGMIRGHHRPIRQIHLECGLESTRCESHTGNFQLQPLGFRLADLENRLYRLACRLSTREALCLNNDIDSWNCGGMWVKLEYELIATIARHVMHSFCLRHIAVSLCGPAPRILCDGSMDVAEAERKSDERAYHRRVFGQLS